MIDSSLTSRALKRLNPDATRVNHRSKIDEEQRFRDMGERRLLISHVGRS